MAPGVGVSELELLNDAGLAPPAESPRARFVAASRIGDLVPFLVAAVLILTGLLKVFQLTGNVLVPDAFPIPRAQMYVWAVLEICAGVWFVLFRRIRLAWRVMQFAFAIFLGITLFNLVVGQPNCGCFGAIQVDPKFMLAMDAVILVTLVIAAPKAPMTVSSALPRFRKRSWYLPTALAVGLLAGAVAVYVPALLSSEAGICIQSGTDVGRAPLGTSVASTLTFSNHGDTPVVVYGAKSIVGDLLGIRLPATVPGGGRLELPIEVVIVGKPGRFSRLVLFYTDAPGSPVLMTRLSGFAVESSGGGARNP